MNKKTESKYHSKIIVFFDGECNLCNSSVQFIIKRDLKNRFLFSALQSETTANIFREHGFPLQLDPQPESIIVLSQNRFYDKSTAALVIAKHIGWLWLPLQIGWIFPKPLRDILYMFISRNRYKWFGKKESCMIPTPELKEKFI
ncbi:MAG: thiol-disulfide oxidoreductase DCC family protein [Bacteroidia bacterium]|nr:thiol-disulfide oxidoreductase DCC family protein [Bacteroidia bacterium]